MSERVTPLEWRGNTIKALNYHLIPHPSYLPQGYVMIKVMQSTISLMWPSKVLVIIQFVYSFRQMRQRDVYIPRGETFCISEVYGHAPSNPITRVEISSISLRNTSYRLESFVAELLFLVFGPPI